MYDQPYNSNTQSPTAPPVAPRNAFAPPSVAPAGAVKVNSQGNSSLIKTIIIILLSLLLVGALLLAYYFSNEYKLASTDVQSQIDTAVIAREKEISDKLEADFAEREKLEYRDISGPEDYGSLSFKYPKTWSVYVLKDASKGGDYEAYLHPRIIPPLTNETVIALHVRITSETFESAVNRYQGLIRDNKITPSIITINGQDANRYDGTLLNNLEGSVVIFKIRDKTVTIETDATIYRDDFDKIIETITFNQ